MRVLFITKKKKETCLPPFLAAQMRSIADRGIEIEDFLITGKSVPYLESIIRLRKFIRENPFDILHAHYTLSGCTAVLTFAGKPIVLSLMGSDILGEYTAPGKTSLKSKLVVLLTYLIQPFVKAIISKSANIHQRVYRKNIAEIIPNGVCLDRFSSEDSFSLKTDLGMDPKKKYILFLNNPGHTWKNYSLAKKAVEILADDNIELLAPFPVSHDKVACYLNAANVLLVTSFMEGSSNVIKEAMACNCPIVTTDVGDAKWVIGNTAGCFITSFEPADVADKIQQALEFSTTHGRTAGRQRIIELGLDSDTIARRIIEVYEKVLH